jgi:hypothetical protein
MSVRTVWSREKYQAPPFQPVSPRYINWTISAPSPWEFHCLFVFYLMYWQQSTRISVISRTKIWSVYWAFSFTVDLVQPTFTWIYRNIFKHGSYKHKHYCQPKISHVCGCWVRESVLTADCVFVTDLINALPGNISVNTVQHATVEIAVFSVDPTDAPIDWLDSDHVIYVYSRSMSLPRLYK